MYDCTVNVRMIRPTFGRPETSSLQTSSQEKVSLQIAAGNFHPGPLFRRQVHKVAELPVRIGDFNRFTAILKWFKHCCALFYIRYNYS